MLGAVGFIPKPNPDSCLAAPCSAAAALGQGSLECIKKTSSHEEKVCREDLDGKTDPREGGKVESKKETADFLFGKN